MNAAAADGSGHSSMAATADEASHGRLRPRPLFPLPPAAAAPAPAPPHLGKRYYTRRYWSPELMVLLLGLTASLLILPLVLPPLPPPPLTLLLLPIAIMLLLMALALMPTNFVVSTI